MRAFRRPFSATSRVRPALGSDEEDSWPVERSAHLTFADREPTVPAGEAANALRGTFLKRHGSMLAQHEHIVHGERARWATRAIMVDDTRGTLDYARTSRMPSYFRYPARHPLHREMGVREPSAAMPLADVTHVRALPFGGHHAGHCLEVCCPPLNLVLQVDNGEEERDRWVEGLRARVQHWKQKAAYEVPTATPVFGDREGGALWRLNKARGW